MKKIPTKRRLDSRNRLSIPFDVRKKLKARTNDEIEFKEEGRKVYIAVYYGEDRREEK